MDGGLPGHVGQLAQLAVGTVFAVAVLAKARSPRSFVAVVAGFDLLPLPLVPVVAVLIVAVEAFVAISLLSGLTVVWGLLSVAAVLATFAVAVGINLLRGRDVACGCFGDDDARISTRTLVRLALLAVATLVAAAGSSRGLPTDLPLASNLEWSVDHVLLQVEATALVLLGMWILVVPDLSRLHSQASVTQVLTRDVPEQVDREESRRG